MKPTWEEVRSALEAAIARAVFPGAALVVGSEQKILFECYVGHPEAAVGEPVAPSTIYDLSSLTKPLATVAIFLRLIAGGGIELEAPVCSVLPAFDDGSPGRARVTIRDLLAHASGLPAHRRYYEQLLAEQASAGALRVASRAGALRVFELAAAEPLERPPRTAAVYSDVGFILLGRIAEIIGGTRLDELMDQLVSGPLGLSSTGFVDVSNAASAVPASQAAPCGSCKIRGGRIRGIVQDENAWAMGGIAGHAGLFATARDVHRIVAEHVRAWCGRPGLLEPTMVRKFWRRDTSTPCSTWALGWDTPSSVGSSAGTQVGSPAVGHLGFTGTSIWVDLARRIHVVLLTNRLEAATDNTAIRAFRPRLHDAVFSCLHRV